MRFTIAFLATCLIAFVIFYKSKTKEENNLITVDTIVFNGRIYTVDSLFSTTEAFAIKNGRIIETGKSEYIFEKYQAVNTINANGNSVFPGFIDSHCHFLNYGLGLNQVELVGTKSFDEVIDRVKTYSDYYLTGETTINDTRWIIGRGWDQNDWELKEYPTNEKLDLLFPNTPVILKRIDGHAALANSKALAIANISAVTKLIGGDVILKNGKPTGVLIDNAVDLVTANIPQPDFKTLKQALLMAEQNCFAVGLTTVTDAGLMKTDIDAIDSLQKFGDLKMRIYAMLSDSAPNYIHYIKHGFFKTDRLNVRSFKFYADGALGSRGACMLKDYSDKKGWSGFLLKDAVEYARKLEELYNHGFQVNSHCIGDSAHRFFLKQYYNTLVFPKKKILGNDTVITIKNNDPGAHYWRWRIEHAQVINPDDYSLYSQTGAIPSVQPTHATSDMYWAEDRIGKDRIKGAYAFKTLLKFAGKLALGTDFPVEDISPFKTFYAAVFRKDAKGFPDGGFTISEALTRMETIKGMTIWGAYANFEEKEKGSIEAGKFADFVILDTDLMTCDETKVLNTKVLYTFVNGEMVYQLK